MPKQILDFSNFRKTAEDGNTATLTHKDGHKIHLVKGILSADLKKHLSKIPLHQSEPEGEVASPDEIPEQTEGLGLGASAGMGQSPVQEGTSTDVLGAPASNILSNSLGGTPVAPANAVPLASNEEQPQVNPAEAALNASGIPEKMKALQGQEAALSKQGDTAAKLYGDRAAEEESLGNQLRQSLDEKQQTIDSVSDDIRNGHIKPNQYLDNMSTGKKFATAIGLILGGMGQGKIGGDNPVMTFLNNQINRNIEAQKADMANKHNLLSALQHQYGSSIVAENMFRAISANALANQLGAAGATAQSALAKSAALNGVGDLKQQAVQYARQAQLMELKDSVNGAPNGAGMDARAQTYLQAARALDPKGAEEFEKRYIPSVGVASVPLDNKDRELLQKKTELQGLLNRASQLRTNKDVLGPIPGTKSHTDASSLQNQIQLKMGELADLTRFTPEENKIYSQLTPDLTGTHFTSKDASLLQGLKNSNDTSLNTLYKQKGIPRSAAQSEDITVIGPKGKGSYSATKSELPNLIKQGYKLVQ